MHALALCVGLLVATLAVLVACGPITPTKSHFCTVVENVSSGPETVTVNWGIGGIYTGSSTRTIPAGAAAVIVMGETAPDLVELNSAPLTSAWGPPDWSRGQVFHIVIPTGFTWSGAF